jgi:hypothetical protein
MMEENIKQLQEKLAQYHGNPDGGRALQIAQEYGYETLGLGGRRLALAISPAIKQSGRVNRISKLAWRKEGLFDNEVEWRLWQHANNQLRERLCPALDIDNGVLVQARCLPVNLEALREGQAIVRFLAQHGITDSAVNLGIYEQRVVCYDYCVLRYELIKKLFPTNL